MHSVFAFGCRDDTFGLPMNPIVGTEKRREPDPAEIVTYTPSEVIAIAEAARCGAHRELIRRQVGEGEQELRRLEDDQNACRSLSRRYAAYGWVSCSRCAGGTSSGTRNGCTGSPVRRLPSWKAAPVNRVGHVPLPA
jgi:hypothetical protein